MHYMFCTLLSFKKTTVIWLVELSTSFTQIYLISFTQIYLTHSILFIALKYDNWYNQPLVGLGGFPGGSEVKNLPVNAEDSGDTGSISGWRRSPGRGNGHPFQYSCLGNLTDRGAWWAIAHGVTESDWVTQHTSWALRVFFFLLFPFFGCKKASMIIFIYMHFYTYMIILVEWIPNIIVNTNCLYTLGFWKILTKCPL